MVQHKYDINMEKTPITIPSKRSIHFVISFEKENTKCEIYYNFKLARNIRLKGLKYGNDSCFKRKRGEIETALE